MGRAIGSDDASAERMYSLIHGYAYVLNAKPIGEGKSVNTPNTIAHIELFLCAVRYLSHSLLSVDFRMHYSYNPQYIAFYRTFLSVEFG